MTVSRVNTKGQVTIPKALRKRFGFQPGDEIEPSKLKAVYGYRSGERTPPSPATGAISATSRDRTLTPCWRLCGGDDYGGRYQHPPGCPDS